MPNISQRCPISQKELEIANVDEFILVNVITGPGSCSYYFIHNSAQNLFFGLDKCPITKSTEEYKVLYLRDLSDGLKEQVLGLADNTEFNPFFAKEELQPHIKNGSFTFKTVATNPATTLEEFENLLTRYPLLIDAIMNTMNNATLLHYFAQDNKTEFVEALIAAGANKEAKTKNGQTPLHIAAGKENAAVAGTLIGLGADIEAKDILGNTPLHGAAIFGHSETVLALITAGADIEAKAVFGKTPLNSAAFHGHTEIVKALITAGANIEAKDENGNTPLHWAAFHGHTEIVKALITAGANIEAKDDHGKTPLHKAANKGRTALVTALIEKGADIEAKSDYGLTPLHCAALKGQTATVLALIDAGSNKEAKNKYSCTPLCLAEKNKHADIVKILAGKAKALNTTSVTSSSIFQPKALQSADNTSGQGNSNTAKADSKPLI